jgi:hypothetical protein
MTLNEVRSLFKDTTLDKIKRAIRDSGIGMTYLSERSRANTIDVLAGMRPDQVQTVYDLATEKEEEQTEPIITLPHLEQRLGLHQEVQIIYVVDGFNATLRSEEGHPKEETDAAGATIQEALINLDKKLGEMA